MFLVFFCQPVWGHFLVKTDADCTKRQEIFTLVYFPYANFHAAHTPSAVENVFKQKIQKHPISLGREEKVCLSGYVPRVLLSCSYCNQLWKVVSGLSVCNNYTKGALGEHILGLFEGKCFACFASMVLRHSLFGPIISTNIGKHLCMQPVLLHSLHFARSLPTISHQLCNYQVFDGQECGHDCPHCSCNASHVPNLRCFA